MSRDLLERRLALLRERRGAAAVEPRALDAVRRSPRCWRSPRRPAPDAAPGGVHPRRRENGDETPPS
jgi:hypothetical protein